MTRTPDEIKKGLECCTAGFYENTCVACPYSSLVMAECPTKLKADALTLIRWHEEKNEAMHAEIVRLQAERDAAVKDVALFPDCCTCKYDPRKKGYIPNDCDDCIEHCNYKWRGVQKEE